MTDWLLKEFLEMMRGEREPPSGAFPISAVIKENRRLDRLRNPKPGDSVPGEGIFLCRWSPVDQDSKSLGKIFNVYAAPEDLTKTVVTYEEAVQLCASLKKWHGFDGGNYSTDKELYQALKRGHYEGQWVIPPCDLLLGVDERQVLIQSDNLYTHRNTGAFQGTFSTVPEVEPSTAADIYWSCTEHPNDYDYTWSACFSNPREMTDKICHWNIKRHFKHSCRLVRFVEVTP